MRSTQTWTLPNHIRWEKTWLVYSVMHKKKCLNFFFFFCFPKCFFKTFNLRLITVCYRWAYSGVNRWTREFFQSAGVQIWTRKLLVKPNHLANPTGLKVFELKPPHSLAISRLQEVNWYLSLNQIFYLIFIQKKKKKHTHSILNFKNSHLISTILWHCTKH